MQIFHDKEYPVVGEPADIVARLMQSLRDILIDQKDEHVNMHAFRRTFYCCEVVCETEDESIIAAHTLKPHLVDYFQRVHGLKISISHFHSSVQEFHKYDHIRYAGGPPIFPGLLLQLLWYSAENAYTWVRYKNPEVNTTMYFYRVSFEAQTVDPVD